ncbi:glycosyltransferase [Acidomonas methanolica]|uniref:glycosyltransferase n=1 Tax=Acidomonas methanolica TaxID=437 RepID=UPI002119E29D|nr:glycosyltransferase [Acidomonas methanolica]MCQ9156288.1 glycosyltransferase [Acidomonas methanolica]
MREIVIFRQNLFRPSETFIAQQAEALTRYRPLYMGRRRFGATPPGREALVLGDGKGLPRRAAAVWQMFSRSPRPYLKLLGPRAPALIHAHFGTDGVLALPVAARLGVPLVTSFHGFDATLAWPAFLMSPAWFHYPLFRGSLARHGALFLCASAFLRTRVLAMGFPAERTLLHYIGVDCAAIRQRAEAEEDETPIILHVARLVEVKGTAYLIRAFARLAGRRPEPRLVIIGEGPLRARLEALARACGVGERVSFLGARPHAEVTAWMRRSAMLVLPSVRTPGGRVEGLGLVLLEAAATGLPVVGTRSGGIPESMLEGETGLLVPERDVEALAGALAALLDDRERRFSMGFRGRAFVLDRFDRARQMERLESLYDDVADGSFPRRP